MATAIVAIGQCCPTT